MCHAEVTGFAHIKCVWLYVYRKQLSRLVWVRLCVCESFALQPILCTYVCVISNDFFRNILYRFKLHHSANICIFILSVHFYLPHLSDSNLKWIIERRENADLSLTNICRSRVPRKSGQKTTMLGNSSEKSSSSLIHLAMTKKTPSVWGHQLREEQVCGAIFAVNCWLVRLVATAISPNISESNITQCIYK